MESLYGIIIVVLIIIIVYVSAELINYRQSVREISNRLKFINENKTSMRLGDSLAYSENKALVKETNKLLEKLEVVEKQATEREETLKEAITDLSHDIRTPLTSLDGYFQLLVDSDDEENRKKYSQVIETKIKSLKDMLEELFTYMRLENDIYEMDMEVTDFSKLVFDTSLSFYDEFKYRGIEPTIDFVDEQLKVMGNDKSLRRVIQNLVKNVLVHGNKWVNLSLKRERDRAIFICANDVDASQEIDVDRLFTRFYKANSARTNISSGLGLTIASKIIEKMNGSIRAEVNDGTFSIIVELPLVTEDIGNIIIG